MCTLQRRRSETGIQSKRANLIKGRYHFLELFDFDLLFFVELLLFRLLLCDAFDLDLAGAEVAVAVAVPLVAVVAGGGGGAMEVVLVFEVLTTAAVLVLVLFDLVLFRPDLLLRRERAFCLFE